MVVVYQVTHVEVKKRRKVVGESFQQVVNRGEVVTPSRIHMM